MIENQENGILKKSCYFLIKLGYELYSKMMSYDDKLFKFYESEGRGVIKNERHINLSSNINHMMVNYVSFPKYQYDAVLGLFQIFVKQTGMRFIELQDDDNWTDFVSKKGQVNPSEVIFINVCILLINYRQKDQKNLSISTWSFGMCMV